MKFAQTGELVAAMHAQAASDLFVDACNAYLDWEQSNYTYDSAIKLDAWLALFYAGFSVLSDGTLISEWTKRDADSDKPKQITPDDLLWNGSTTFPMWIKRKGDVLDCDQVELQAAMQACYELTRDGNHIYSRQKQLGNDDLRGLIQKHIDLLDLPSDRADKTITQMVARLKAGVPVKQDEQLQTFTLDGVEVESNTFLIDPYVPIGKLTMIQSDSGVGKTFLACALTALVTGARVADCPIRCSEVGKVLLLSGEDSPSDLRQRVEDAGGDLSKVIMVKEDQIPMLGLGGIQIYDLIRKVQPKLVVIDPLQLFLDGVDMNRANQTRPLLHKLSTVIKEVGCACIIIAHNGKMQQRGIYASIGSVDIPAIMRSIIGLYHDADRKSKTIHAIHIKSSNAANGLTINYQIGPVEGKAHAGKVRWLGLEDYSEADHMAAVRAVERADIGEQEYNTNPIMDVVRKIAADNPDRDVRIDHASFARVYEEITGHVMRESSTSKVTRTITKMSECAEAEGLVLTTMPATIPTPFLLNGCIEQVGRNKCTCIRIRKIKE